MGEEVFSETKGNIIKELRVIVPGKSKPFLTSCMHSSLCFLLVKKKAISKYYAQQTECMSTCDIFNGMFMHITFKAHYNPHICINGIGEIVFQ